MVSKKKKYTLVDTNEAYAYGGANEFNTYQFISNVGVTKGGLYYSFSSTGICMTGFDMPYYSFKGYGADSFYFSEQICDIVGLNSANILQSKLQSDNGILKFEPSYIGATIQLVDVFGRTILKTTKNTVNVSKLNGLYFIFVEVGKYLFTYKVSL